MKYIQASKVKRFIHEQGKQCTPEFLEAVDKSIEFRLKNATRVHNGGGKRLTLEVAIFVGFKY